jgi:hypothetical protein
MRVSATAVYCIMIIISFCISGNAWAGTIYDYVDRDGSVVFTDSPPPGVNARPIQSFKKLTEEENRALEKERSSRMESFRESEEKRKEKEEKIRAARAEYEQALQEEQRFRSNKNQARGYAQQRYWIKMMEEQSKEIEEKKKKLQEIESEY